MCIWSSAIDHQQTLFIGILLTYNQDKTPLCLTVVLTAMMSHQSAQNNIFTSVSRHSSLRLLHQITLLANIIPDNYSARWFFIPGYHSHLQPCFRGNFALYYLSLIRTKIEFLCFFLLHILLSKQYCTILPIPDKD